MYPQDSPLKTTDFTNVTELPGSKASHDQILRLKNRYAFAAKFCRDKDVLELACGAGIGLGLLNKACRVLVGGDIDLSILGYARNTYPGNEIPLLNLDARFLPFEDNSFDAVILFEAIYYLNEAKLFIAESKRILRDNGTLIICNPNKDLPDFNPSPYSHRYFNAADFHDLLTPQGFGVEVFGDDPVEIDSLKAKIFRIIKKLAVSMNLMPKTMKGKEFFKRLVFGRLTEMPSRIDETEIKEKPLNQITSQGADDTYKVLFCVATKQ